MTHEALNVSPEALGAMSITEVCEAHDVLDAIDEARARQMERTE